MIRTLTLAASALVLTACDADTIYQARPVERTVSVTGEGQVAGVPDLALLSFAVRSRAGDAGAAFSSGSQVMNRVIDTLKKEGIEARDLQTDQISLQPFYAQNERGYQDRARIAGYEAVQSLTVRLRSIERAGEVIDAAVDAGANELQSFQLTFDDPARLAEEARVAAVKDAERKARAMAEAAGASLGKVVSLSAFDGGGPRPVAMRSAMAEAAPMDATRIEAGEQELRVTVSAVFEID